MRAAALLSTALARQSPQALDLLVRGWCRAATAGSDGRARAVLGSTADIDETLRAVVLAVVLLIHLEDRQLRSGQGAHAAELLSLRRLYEQLGNESRPRPRGMNSRHGAWQRLCTALRDSPIALRCHPRQSTAGTPWHVAAASVELDDRTVYGALRELMVIDGRAPSYADLPVEHLGSVFETLLGYRAVAAEDGQLTLQASEVRRATGSHYTPRELARPIVERALEPLLRGLGPKPRPDELLDLRICDPAMGSGAFLVACCQLLAEQVIAAWSVWGEPGRTERGAEPAPVHARRLVASCCLFGVDRDPLAVELARLSLWLTVGNSELPLSALDANLRCGDSLVGLHLAELRAIDRQAWGDSVPAGADIGAALMQAAQLRRRVSLLARAGSASPSELARQQRRVEALVEAARCVADLIVGAFFARDRDAARRQERAVRLAAVAAWRRSGGPLPDHLREQREQLRARTPAFHWPIEFPEIFLSSTSTEGGRAGFDAVVGNPPFLGGKRISTEHGHGLASWLQQLHSSTKNTDLAAHFFRRADGLVAETGTVGLIATNTLAQGATRRDGLQRLLSDDRWRIYDAERSRSWPGDATVSVSIVHLAKGRARELPGLVSRLDGEPVRFINSSLRAMPERREAAKLRRSCGVCFIGCFLRGAGFILSSAERRQLVARRPANQPYLPPYLGGDEVNTSPTHEHRRYVIAFQDRSLEQAECCPELLAIVRQRVKPRRDGLRDWGVNRGHRNRWWQFANTRPELRAALRPLRRCLVAPRVSKHLCFAFQSTARVFSDQLCVFAIDDYARFAVLQSRVHETWARLHSSTFGEGLRYTPSTCVETFPWPDPRSLAGDGLLQRLGRVLYVTRARFMRDVGRGLTATYNLLTEPRCVGRQLIELRQLHVELDRAVMSAYGWSDLAVPDFGRAAHERGRSKLEHFQQELISRLYDLNESLRERGS